jgi:hypothetical protein
MSLRMSNSDKDVPVNRFLLYIIIIKIILLIIRVIKTKFKSTNDSVSLPVERSKCATVSGVFV